MFIACLWHLRAAYFLDSATVPGTRKSYHYWLRGINNRAPKPLQSGIFFQVCKLVTDGFCYSTRILCLPFQCFFASATFFCSSVLQLYWLLAILSVTAICAAGCFFFAEMKSKGNVQSLLLGKLSRFAPASILRT